MVSVDFILHYFTCLLRHADRHGPGKRPGPIEVLDGPTMASAIRTPLIGAHESRVESIAP